MAFDVYVGSMTRFYRREWENAGQRLARKMGAKYNMIYAGGEPDPPPPADEIRDVIGLWCAELTEGLRDLKCGEIKWNEGDEAPYFTERPAWEGYAGLLIWTAYAEQPKLTPPAILPERWDSDLAYKKSSSPNHPSLYQQILRANLWIPADFNAVVEGPDLCGEQAVIGSTFELKRALDHLADSRPPILQGESVPETKQKSKWASLFGARKKQIAENPAQQGNSLIACAGQGLSIFRQLAEKACENRLPIMLSY